MIRQAGNAAVLLALVCACTRANAERLVLASASYGKNVVAICDADGKVLWSHPTTGPKTGHAGHHDIQLLDNGNVLFHENWTTVVEMTLDGKVVWSYDSATRNGNKGKHVEVHAFQRLPDGLTMIAESGVGRIIEVDREGNIRRVVKLRPGGRQHTRMVRKLPNGHYLVCAENPGVVTEYDGKGEVVWEYPTKTRVYGAIRLRNGNTLIASGGGASVVEVTPQGKVVWEIKDTVPGTKIGLKWTTFLTELDNGNLIVGNCHAGERNPQIFEITHDKQVVWQFSQFALFGNGLACSQVLNDRQSTLVRKLLAKANAKPDARGDRPTSHTVRKLEGWTVRVDDRLLQPPHEELGRRALRYLENKLADIKVVIPAERVKQLQAVTIVLDLNHGKLVPMQYHPGKDWLLANGYSPDLVKCVHLPRAGDLPTRRNIREQPWAVLHELAHAYHDQVLGFDEPRIKEAYEAYRKSGHGEKTLLHNGKRVRHYALTNHKEFFAEMTEAYFGANDFFPFNRAELREAEPAIYALLRDIWESPPKGKP